MIIFKNSGVIDMRALRTFGLTSKSGEDTIGRFGTGLKYATAVIAREGGKMTVETAGERYEIGSVKEEFRGQEVTQLTMNGIELPYTAALGRDWEPWMAFRELYSNALDEGGDVLRSEKPIEACGDETIISVELNAFEAIFFSMEEHFITKDESPIWSCDDVELYAGRSLFIFYRGIAIKKLEEPAAFRYNLTGHVELTEDRTAKYEWQLRNRLETALSETDSEDVARAIVDKRNPYEATFDFSLETGSETFVGASIKLGSDSNTTARAVVQKQLPDDPDLAKIGTISGKGMPGGDALNQSLFRLQKAGADMSKATFVLAVDLSFYGDYEVKSDIVYLNECTFEDADRMTLACVCAYAEIEGNRWLARRLIEITQQKEKTK